MDFLQKAVGQVTQQQTQQGGQATGEQSVSNNQGDGSFFDGLKNKVNSAAGGGAEGEKNEDMLDKWV